MTAIGEETLLPKRRFPKLNQLKSDQVSDDAQSRSSTPESEDFASEFFFWEETRHDRYHFSQHVPIYTRVRGFIACAHNLNEQHTRRVSMGTFWHMFELPSLVHFRA